jgi:D-alanine-D-alanine ligase
VDIGIAFDLKSDFAAELETPGAHPEDALEEYDSLTTIEALEHVLAGRGHSVRRMGGGKRFVEAALACKPDLVFNLSEGRGTRSREAHVPAVCEMLGIRCTHSDPLTMAVSLDKGVAKRLVASYGVPTPRHVVIADGEVPRELGLRFPLFAKPLAEGSSMGIRRTSRIESHGALVEWVTKLWLDYKEPVLIEEFCAGPEFTVGILGTGDHAHVVSAMEVVPKQVPPERFVYSLEVKRNLQWKEEVEYVAPPRRSAVEIARIETVALEAYRALGCRDVGRIDVRMNAAGEPLFLEANPLPGIAPGWSDLALLFERLGKSYNDLVLAIFDEACRRLGLAG